MLSKEEQSPKSPTGKKAYVERKVSVFSGRHMDKCSKGDSCSFSHHRLASRNICDGSETKNDDRLLPRPIRRQNRLTARDKNPHRKKAMGNISGHK